MGKLKKWILRSILLFLALSVLLTLPLRWIDPPLSMVMLNRWWTSENPQFLVKKQWRNLEDMPRHAAMAVIVSEDQRFLQHHGVDVAAIRKAYAERRWRGELRGASTITQQVARNLYLWTGRSWFRKGLEAWLSLLIDFFWDKGRVLEIYLNIAEWDEGVFGLQAASRAHFGVDCRQLTPWQSALLASSLPSPIRYRPEAPAPHLVERAKWNLSQQRQLGGTAWIAPLYR